MGLLISTAVDAAFLWGASKAVKALPRINGKQAVMLALGANVLGLVVGMTAGAIGLASKSLDQKGKP